MLGKTHEVTAPTGLLKVMESAVVDLGIPYGTQPDHIVLWRICVECTPMGRGPA
jgi:hypothetical protein